MADLKRVFTKLSQNISRYLTSNAEDYDIKQYLLFQTALAVYMLVHIIGTIWNINDFFWPPIHISSIAIDTSPLLYVLVLFGFLMLLGVYPKISAFIIWLGMRYFIGNNLFNFGVNTDYFGFLLLLYLFIPNADPIFKKNKTLLWSMPKPVYHLAWLVLGSSLTASGLNKILYGEQWQTGLAMQALLNRTELTFINFSNLANSFPLVPKFLSWLSLGIELFYLPSIFFKKTRMLIFFLSLGMFINITLFFIMSEVGVIMLIFHLLIFDSTWFRQRHEQ